MTSVAQAVPILLSILFVGQAFGQEPSYYWNEEETTTTATETTTNSVHREIFTITAYDEELTPVFVVNSEVCNAPRAVVFALKSTADNINFTIEKSEFRNHTYFRD